MHGGHAAILGLDTEASSTRGRVCNDHEILSFLTIIADGERSPTESFRLLTREEKDKAGDVDRGEPGVVAEKEIMETVSGLLWKARKAMGCSTWLGERPRVAHRRHRECRQDRGRH